MRRFLLSLVAVSALAPDFCEAGHVNARYFKLCYTDAQEAAIKSMPIEQRPMRVGHVYGNTVRRVSRFQEWQQR